MTTVFFSFLAFFLVCLVSCDAYRLGQVVDTFIRTDVKAEDAMRSQMPTFGVSSSSYFPERPQRFSLSFEEGMRPLNWVYMRSSDGQMLESLEITFVYSKSGDGVIHAISSKPNYSKRVERNGFTVKYFWVEEEEVDPQAGMALMFLICFLVTITMLIDTCGSIGISAGGETKRSNSTATADLNYAYQQQSTMSTGVPKWD